MPSISLTYTYIFVNILIICYLSGPIECAKITTKQGTLEGILLSSRNGTQYSGFYGLPYAKAPVGELRFADPQEPETWEGIRNATQYRTTCLQRDPSHEISGEEDCLYLNVFTPNKLESDTLQLLPTMVFIHGGGMVNGSSAFYDPVYFMDYCVVLVTIQYRLNIFGFISATDDVLPGNYGMKDQVAALKWVQQNIASFGGDPNRITLFGHSSGGASVHLHMHSPLSKGLFQQAISQSGSALASWVVQSSETARQKAIAFAKTCDCVFEPTSEFLQCLRKIPALRLLECHDVFRKNLDKINEFTVVVENRSVKNAFLIENPWLQNVSNEVPWMTGITSGEGGFRAMGLLVNPEKLKDWETNYRRFFPMVFGYEWMDEKTASETSDKLRNFYFDDDPLDKDPHKLVDIHTDGLFAIDCIEAAKRYKKKRYFYLYDHRNVHSLNDLFGQYKETDLGVCHADDLISLFSLPRYTKVTEGPDFEVSKRMMKFWLNFASRGDPNGEGKVWQPVESNEFEYLHITTETDVMRKDLWAGRYKFWKSLPMFKKYDIVGANSENKIYL